MEFISKNNSLETAKNRLDISGLTYVDGTKYVYDRILDRGLNGKLIKYIPLVETSGGYILRYKNLMRQYYWLINEFIPSCSYEKLCMRNGEKKWIKYDNLCDTSRTYLTFSFYDGDSLIASISVASGNTATSFTPSKTGYSFSGWTTENGGNVFFDFSTPITENTSVYAKYEIKELQIRFRLNNGEPDIVITVNYGDTPSISDPQKEGYTFNGWSPEITPATKNAIYEATYTQDIYIIRFFNVIDSEHVLSDYNNQPIDGGSTTEYKLIRTETLALHDQSEYYLTRPTYQHFECVEEGGNTWWIDRSGNPISASTFLDVTQDLIEVFPKLTKKNYTVSFLDWDNSVISEQTVEYLGNAVAPASPSMPHYTFAGWDKSYTGITDNTTIHAMYVGETINVTYMLQDTGGTFVVYSSLTTTYNSTAPTVAEPGEGSYPPEDYGVFDGWYSDSSYSIPFDYTTLLNSNTIIYGKWKTEFEVAFYNYNGTLITGDTQTGFANPVYVAYGEDVSDTELDLIINNMLDYPGHEFLGWDNSTTGITKDTRNTAVFDSVQMCRVRFINSINGYVISEVNVPFGTTILVSNYPIPPEVEYMTFKNWNGNTYAINRNVDVYAVYEYVDVELQFVDYNGNVLSTTTVKYGSTGFTPDGITVPDLKVRLDLVNEPEVLSTIRFNGTYCYVRDEFDPETGCTTPEETVITSYVTKFMAQYDVIATETTTCNVRFYNYDSSYWFTDTVLYGTVIDSAYSQSVLDIFISEGETPDLDIQTFYAWADSNGNEYVVGQNDLVVTDDISLYAKYKMISYRVQFYAQSNPLYYPGTIDIPIASLEIEAMKNKPINRPDCSIAPERAYFETFCDGPDNRWYTDSSCTIEWAFTKNEQGQPIANPDIVTHDMILYGRYIGREFHLTYYKYEGEPVTQESYRYPIPTVRPTNPTMSGFTFIDWFTYDGVNKVKFTFGDPLTSDTTVYGEWIEAPEENTVLYNASADLSPYITQIDYSNLSRSAWDDVTGDGVLVYDNPIEVFNIGTLNNDSSVTVNNEIKRNLHTITIPKGVTNVVTGQFEDCRYLYAIYTSEDNEKYYSVNGVLYSSESGTSFSVVESYPQAKAEETFTLEDARVIIGKLCFANSKKLKSVNLGTNLIGNREKAFLNCTKLEEITCLSVVPPTTSNNAFNGVDVGNCKLYVPCQSYTSYSEHAVWGQFDIECTGSTGSYITFTAVENNSSIGLAELSSNQQLWYSADGVDWSAMTTATTVTLANSGDTVYVRGILSSGNTDSDYTQFNMTGKIAASGNANYLWNYENTDAPLKEYCGCSMFYNCTSLTEAPELSATTLANYCYAGMFINCTSLTEAPVLPATTLAEGCYSSMFGNCTSLTEAPELSATTLANYCYQYMFLGCSGLTTAPELPATILSEGCYDSMFYNCTSLTTAPELPATNLSGASSCYSSMFGYCMSLTVAPVLSATTLANYCYTQMFYHCSGLTTAPELPATTLANYCYAGMFNGCTSLTEAPVLPATTLAEGCYQGMFDGCTGLTTAPELPATALTDDCYYEMFLGCSNLNYIKCLAVDGIIQSGSTYNWVYGVATSGLFIEHPDAVGLWPINNVNGIPVNWVVSDIDYLRFTAQENNSSIGLAKKSNNQSVEYSYDCQNWTTIANTAVTVTLTNSGDTVYVRGVLSGNNTSNDYTQFRMAGTIAAGGNINTLWDYNNLDAQLKEYCGISLFEGCSGLTKAPDLPATALTPYCYYRMFSNCSSLTTASELPATTLANNCYYSMFLGCTSLTTAPALPATTLANECYSYMFRGCSGLTTAPVLPATNLSGASYCYCQMFLGCSSLITAPALPATALTNSCYSGMFRGCSSLTEVPELPAITLAELCYEDMFSNCSGLTTAHELPATTLEVGCYQSMFAYCSSLTEIPSDLLPATALTYNCYSWMFQGCTSLTTAPELPATTLARNCYQYMFQGCTSLNYIKCLAVNGIDRNGSTTSWVDGVSDNGTFIKNSSANWGAPSVNTTPPGSGWSVIDA